MDRYTSRVIGLLTLLAIAFVVLLALFTGVLVYEMRHPPRRTTAYALARGLSVDPEAVGLAFTEWNVESDGATLPVWDIAAHGDAPATAVFVHGWGMSRIDMLARIGPWPQLVSRIIMVDLRGHGEASAPGANAPGANAPGTSAPGMSNLGVGECRDLIALLEALDADPIVLVGFSMGAVIAIETAAMDSPVRDRIAGVVAFGPYDDFHTSLRGRLTVAGYPSRPLTDLALFILRMTGLRHQTLAAQAEQLHCPLLVIHGERDRVVPVSHGKRIAAAAPISTLRTVPDGAHLDLHLADEEAVREAVTEFVSSLERWQSHAGGNPVLRS